MGCNPELVRFIKTQVLASEWRMAEAARLAAQTQRREARREVRRVRREAKQARRQVRRHLRQLRQEQREADLLAWRSLMEPFEG
jgi:hypothetical protein